VETLTYHLETFDGPLDLLLSLVQKNKVDISDIPIFLICDQYMAYIQAAEALDMDVASEFLVMASELMLIKSKMLLPRAEPEAEDPRALLAETLLRYQQAKEGAAWLAARYPTYSGRMSKDTDEISVDKTYVADQSVLSLCQAVRRIIAVREERPRAEKVTFTPMIASPIVPVEAKIIGILNHFKEPPPGKTAQPIDLQTLLEDAVSLPDMIAIFLGVLELVRMRRILLVEDGEEVRPVLGLDACFVAGDDADALPGILPDDTSTDSPAEFGTAENSGNGMTDHATKGECAHDR
jgi:segregation and condensation protein A